MRDVEYYQNEMRKSSGTFQYGSTLPDPALYGAVYERQDGSIVYGMVITTKKLYQLFGNVLTEIPPTPGGFTFTTVGTALERFQSITFDDVFYFVSPNNALRKWPGGASTHSAVSGGFPAKGIMALNNHVVLVNTKLGGTLEPQTVRWSQNYAGTISFSGLGSGANELADTQGGIQNCHPLTPLNGLIYKTDSVIEMRATGDVDAPFEFVERARGIGLLLPYTISSWKGAQFFVGSDEQIYLFDGGRFEDIGSPIRTDFFSMLDQTVPDHACAVFDPVYREYVIALPEPGTATQGAKPYFAYNVDHNRWRYGERAGVTWMETIRYKFILSSPAVQITRAYTGFILYAGKIVSADPLATAFNGIEASMSYETADFIAEKDGEEGTLLEVIIGYHAHGVSFSLTIDISRDEGTTFEFPQTKTLGSGLGDGTTQYEHVYFNVTGMKFRVRLRNSTANQLVHIRSIDLRMSTTAVDRPGAKK